MITKEEFCNVFYYLQKQNETDENFNKGVRLMFPDSIPPIIPNGNLWTAVIKALQYAMNDEFEFIEWWVFEDKMKGELAIKNENGEEIFIKTPGQLYDYIINLNSEQ